MGILVQGRAAVQDLTAMNGLAGENSAAFAMAVGEAAANQADPLIPAEGGGEGNPEGKEKRIKPDEILHLQGIPALLMQGAYLMQKVPEPAGEKQVLPIIKVRTPETGLPVTSFAVNRLAGNETNSLTWNDVNGLASKGDFQRADAPGGQAADLAGEASGTQAAKVVQDTMAEDVHWKPETVRQIAKGKDALEKTSFEAAQKLREQPPAKTAQPVADLPAREALKPITGASEPGNGAARVQAFAFKADRDVKEPVQQPAALVMTLGEGKGKPVQAPAAPAMALGREMEKPVQAHAAAAPAMDREKGKPMQVPAAAVTAAFGAGKAVPLESMASTKETAPENTTKEENAAMQVARASVRALRRGMTEYRVRLKPEGLGEVEVTVVTKGRAVSLSMRTTSEAARGLILGHADELRAELNAQEYHVSGLTVEVGMDNGGGAGFFASQEHAEPSFGQGHAIKEQSAVPEPSSPGRKAEPIRIIPRNSTINYRI